MLKNDSDHLTGDLEIFVDLRDISVLDTNIETNKGDEVMSDEKGNASIHMPTILSAIILHF